MASRSNGKKGVVEKRPQMLKEFLLRDSDSNSCSSTGFKSFPRRSPDDDRNPRTVQKLIDHRPEKLPRSRSRSRAAAEAAVSSFQKLLHAAVRSLQFVNSSSPSVLPRTTRSLSKRLSMNFNWSKKKSDRKVIVSVKVKDILRWRSFRDAIDEEKSQPLDSVGATSTSGNSIENESELSFTVDELPWWWGDSIENGKKLDDGDGRETVEQTTGATDCGVGVVDNQNVASCEEDKDQNSPVSVLGSPFREETSDEEFVSSFDQSLANVERTKQRLLESIQLFESLAGVHEFSDEEHTKTEVEEEVLEERKQVNAIEAKRRAYLSRGLGLGLSWGKRGELCLKDREEWIKDMERKGRWSKFEEERPEIGVALEVGLLSDLMDDFLVDLFESAKLNWGEKGCI